MKSNVRKGISVLLCLAMVFAMIPNFSGVNANAENLIGSRGEGVTIEDNLPRENTQLDNLSVGAPAESEAGLAENETQLDVLAATNEDATQLAVSGGNKDIDKGTWAECIINEDKSRTYTYADFSPFVVYSLQKECTLKDSTSGDITISNAEQLAGLMVIVNAKANTTIEDKNLTVTIDDKQSFSGCTIKLDDDIDLSERKASDGTELKWVPIGMYDKGTQQYRPFSATLDGDGHEVKGMKIGTAGSPEAYICAGLIGYYEGHSVSNIGIGANSAVYNSDSCTGGLIGRVTSASVTIENCYNSGGVNGEYCVGGLIGSASAVADVTLTNCYNSGGVSGNYDVGGLIGSASAVANASADVDVTLTNCYNSGKIDGDWDVGGLIGGVGSGSSVKLTNCYNSGVVSGSGWGNVGGLIGFADADADADADVTVENGYYLGAAQGVSNIKDIKIGAISLLKNAQTDAVDLQAGGEATISNTEASKNLRGADKLGENFKMEYIYEYTEDKGVTISDINESTNAFSISAERGAESCRATLKEIKIDQNSLETGGYTGSIIQDNVVSLTEDQGFDIKIEYILTFNTNGGSWA